MQNDNDFLPLSPYCNGGGCDCLTDRYLPLERHAEEEAGAEDEEVCVLSSTGTRSSVCLWRMMDYMGATEDAGPTGEDRVASRSTASVTNTKTTAAAQ
ncbi:hypothetical protein EYF80_021311 [Liparis tanakae]|uniref:Uncharacterized protein n=1 Tax=Liparis tanakae TaxID=230148 RepID=A0A4Z2HRQ9_9TELE|nr:hypothetical protein EYF80_021311 [Liparis tanakae]